MLSNNYQRSNLPPRAFVSVEFHISIYMTGMLFNSTTGTLQPIFFFDKIELMVNEVPVFKRLRKVGV